MTFRQARSYPRNPQDGCYQCRCLVNRGTMSVNSLPKTVTRQRRDCDLNPGPSAPESSTLTTRLRSVLVQQVMLPVVGEVLENDQADAAGRQPDRRGQWFNAASERD